MELRPPGVLGEWLGRTETHTHGGPALSSHFLHSNQPIVGFGWLSARLNKHYENKKAAGIVIHQQLIEFGTEADMASLCLVVGSVRAEKHRAENGSRLNTICS